MRPSFDPRRLTLARRLKQLSKKQLADLVDVSAASITQYEAGRTVPPDETQARLALACGVPQAYLLRAPDRRRPDFASQSFFRSLRSTTQTERDQADALAEHVMDIAEVLNGLVHLPPVDIPSLHPQTGTRVEIEGLAREVRDAWNVPPGPVANMTRLLEAHGVVVSRLHSMSDNRRLDGFSRWFGERPLILLWADKADKARSRFDAAHELGHMVMHSDADPASIEQERQANFFASAFLMPTPEIDPDLARAAPTLNSWPELLDRRAHWGVSAKALLYRSRELGALPEFAFRRAMQNYNRHGLMERDGSALGEPEEVKLLATACQHAGVTPREIAALTHLSESFVCDAIGVASDGQTHETTVISLSDRRLRG